MDNKRKFNDYYYGMAKKSKKDEDSGSDDEKSLASILKGAKSSKPEKIEKYDNHVYFYSEVSRESIFELNMLLKEVEEENIITANKLNIDPIPIYLHINSYGGSVFAGFAAIGIKEAMDAEVQLNKLGQTLTNFGVNTAENREQIKELTDGYVELGFGGDVAMGAFNTLLTTTGNLTKSQDLLALSADLARVKQIDLGSAASILSKASIGNAKAFKEMGIELDSTLPKQQAIDKAMAQLTARIGGQAQAATKTFAIQLQILKEKVLDIAESLGATLIPIIQNFIDFVGDAINFVKKYSDAFKLIGTIIVGVTLALVAYNVTVKVTTALTKAWGIATGVVSIATKILTGQQIALNTAMKANPIGLIVAGLTLVGVAVVYL